MTEKEEEEEEEEGFKCHDRLRGATWIRLRERISTEEEEQAVTPGT